MNDMMIQCPDCKGKGRVNFMQSPTAPEVICHRCGGAKVITYRDPVSLYHGKYELVKCDCDDGDRPGHPKLLHDECPKCHGEGASRVRVA